MSAAFLPASIDLFASTARASGRGSHGAPPAQWDDDPRAGAPSRRGADPRAWVPCRVVCLLFSVLTAICLLMPWVTYRSGWPSGLREGMAGVPLGIPDVPDVIAALAQDSVLAAALFALASLACAVALMLIVLGAIRILRFRQGVGLLRGGLGIVALVVVLGGPAIVAFRAGLSFSAFRVTDWPGYALLCAAVASIAASRYDRLAGPDVDADDARMRAEGFAVRERRAVGPSSADDWHDNSARVALTARPGRAETVMRAVACVAGALGVVLAVPLLVSTVLVVTMGEAWTGGSATVDAGRLILESPYLLAWVAGAAALVFAVQGIVSFVRDRRTTGLLRTGALLMLFGPPLSGGVHYLPHDLMYALMPGLAPSGIDGAYIAYVLAYIALAALAAILAGLADGMAFARASRTVDWHTPPAVLYAERK